MKKADETTWIIGDSGKFTSFSPPGKVENRVSSSFLGKLGSLDCLLVFPVGRRTLRQLKFLVVFPIVFEESSKFPVVDTDVFVQPVKDDLGYLHEKHHIGTGLVIFVLQLQKSLHKIIVHFLVFGAPGNLVMFCIISSVLKCSPT